jgi:hypothetical protein
MLNMKLQSLLSISVFSVFLSVGFSQCSTMKISETIQLDKEQAANAYYQHWIAGVRGGGSGTNVFIHESILEGKDVDSIYFQNKVAKLELPKAPNRFYTAYFKRDVNQRETRGLPHDDHQKLESGFPFKLENNEAVISFFTASKTKYFKLTNIVKKESLDYPSAPKGGLR